eukprot:scaffold27684_cov52-Phaeocystis_antarctica.AAC.4
MSVTRTTGTPSGGAIVISAESFALKYSARVGRWTCQHARRGGQGGAQGAGYRVAGGWASREAGRAPACSRVVPSRSRKRVVVSLKLNSSLPSAPTL